MAGSMSEISKAYEPAAVEEKWYAEWLEHRCFSADASSAKPAFSIVIPPPNVTGVLTLGHVLNNTLQDILARRARQTGHEVLWLPGTDHAGIATQTVVERQLRKEEGKTRRDLGREAFLERVWTWKEKHGGIIIKQLKRLGCSCDWDRGRFTMDEDYSRQVQEVFVKLHAQGLVYRGKRMVNWCPVSQTALSDEEVIMKPAKGKLYVMRYEVAEEPGTFLEIATTRPETLMGDTAVAVHPDDPRYARFIGKHAVRPFPRAEIPIIGDTHIDMTFGTGVLKVTPAHDKADFEIGQRHGLEVLDVMNPDGTLNALAGAEFDGMERFAAREAAAAKLEEMGLLVRVEDYENNVGYSERADVPIEPRLSEQWFLKYPQVPASLDAVVSGKIRFVPERWARIYEHWMTNIQDWCISRQLWWGHRIPVWYRKDDPSVVHVGLDAPTDADKWRQDEDVLDTWFSSWLWPFATMDEATRKKFYPTNDLVTGPDIIFFWVARMIMAGLEFTGEVPFRNVSPASFAISKDVKCPRVSAIRPIRSTSWRNMVRTDSVSVSCASPRTDRMCVSTRIRSKRGATSPTSCGTRRVSARCREVLPSRSRFRSASCRPTRSRCSSRSMRCTRLIDRRSTTFISMKRPLFFMTFSGARIATGLSRLPKRNLRRAGKRPMPCAP